MEGVTDLLDPRARRRVANHEAIAVVALRLASERGLDGFTVEELAHEAGISRRTFFNHFGSKEEAVVEVARTQLGRMLDAIGSAAPECDGPELLARGVRALLDPRTVADVRALVDLAEASPALVPHLAAIQEESLVGFAGAATACLPLAEFAPVHAYAYPGAVMAAVSAVYTRRLHVVEVDGPAPSGASSPVLDLDAFIDQLRVLLPTPAHHLPS